MDDECDCAGAVLDTPRCHGEGDEWAWSGGGGTLFLGIPSRPRTVIIARLKGNDRHRMATCE